MGWGSDQPWNRWVLDLELVPVYRRFRSGVVTRHGRTNGEAFIRGSDLDGLKEKIAEVSHQRRRDSRLGRPAWNKGKKGTGGKQGVVMLMRCHWCNALIRRTQRLPLNCPECKRVAWDPKVVPTLELVKGTGGAYFVKNWQNGVT
jgi:hypothetical protein